MTAWYVVQAKQREESRARSNLVRQGFEVYLPCFAKKRRHARRTDTVAAPLFPGYLFIQIDTARDRWRSINGTIGVKRLICHGNRPARVPDGVVECLRAREDDNGLVPLACMMFLERGTKVRIVDGALSDCIGFYQRMTEDQRIVVLLDLLGRSVSVELPMDAIDAA